ncbi:tRNA lysidine(34) synthetase TilS [Agarivorans sp. DSG3-1]|uniref:tRNA lysidine(34) synthetase TilS n=1 Tax=Agarivorans sp. DSG3-1 TaxID=3342249 RepID=UPI00398E57A5
MSIQSLFNHSFKQLPTSITRIVVAYSGGLDSRVLLHLAAEYVRLQADVELLAVHVNHGLQHSAAQWQEHCRLQANALSVEFVAEQVSVEVKPRESLEAVAREKRYAALAKHIDAKSCLLTGHHADDQFETFTLALKRGSGLQGLAAMPLCRSFAKGVLLRPLLTCSRVELETYAKQQGLTWVEDPSNQSLEFDRNFVRHQVLPTFSKRWPQWLHTAQRSVQHLQEAVSLLDELAELDYQNCISAQALVIASLTTLSQARQKNLIRFWFKLLDWDYPSQSQLAQIMQQIEAKDDAKVAITFSEGQLRRFKNKLYLVNSKTLVETNSTVAWLWDRQRILNLQNNSQISWQAGGSLLPPNKNQQVTIRFRQQVEQGSFDALERNGNRSIKKLLQEAGLAPWLRNRIPFVFYNDDLVAIGHLYTHRQFNSTNNQGVTLNWQSVC